MTGEKSNFQFILRLLNTNVDGKQKVMYALTKIKGVGRRYSNLVCKKADVDLSKRCVFFSIYPEFLSLFFKNSFLALSLSVSVFLSCLPPTHFYVLAPFFLLLDYTSHYPQCG